MDKPNSKTKEQVEQSTHKQETELMSLFEVMVEGLFNKWHEQKQKDKEKTTTKADTPITLSSNNL